MPKLRFYSWFPVVALFLISHLSAQVRTQDSDLLISNFPLYKSVFFNYDTFFYCDKNNTDSLKTFLHVSLVNDLLQFPKKSDSLYVARFELSAMILDSTESLYQSVTIQKTLQASSFEETNSRAIFHHYYSVFWLPPGKYRLLLNLMDLDTRKALKRDQELTIPTPSSDRIQTLPPVVLTRSNQEKLQPFRAETSNSLPSFFSDSLTFVFPFTMNKLNYFRINQFCNVLWEVLPASVSAPVKMKYRLLNSSNEELWAKTEEREVSQNRSIRLHIPIHPSDYPPGYYVLHLTVDQDNLTKNTQARFYFSHKLKGRTKRDTTVDEFAAMRYIVDEETYKEWESLNSNLRSVAVDTFWAHRNPGRKISENPLRKEFLRRIRFANENFVSLVENRAGWETDQGKVYIVYGPPDEILHPRSPDTQYQHEIWVYVRHPRDQRFIFVFKPEKGEYVLLRKE